MIGHVLEWAIVRVLARLFPKRWRVIPRLQDGVPMLRQFRIFDWLYLQSFLVGELPELFHFHRWRYMRSFVLSGVFWEERYPGGGRNTIRHAAPSTYSMDHTVIHNLCGSAPRTWTLFLMFGNRKMWGYYERPRELPSFIPWDEAIPETRIVNPL